MDDFPPKGNCSPLPLSALKLLVPPVRLVSAVIWKTIQRKVVADYGMLEEFVSTVTDILPKLLTTHQRAQLILGLRARLILELCQFDADFDVVQPHLDRVQTFIDALVMEVGAANVEVPRSEFVDLVKNLLRNPNEREHFFQNIFPEEFGPAYDEALHTLMWMFLSRLEKFLPLQTFQQVSTMLGEESSVLEECTMSRHEELRSLLRYQKDLNHLDHNDGSLDGACIISALKLPPLERSETDNKHQQANNLLSFPSDLDNVSFTLPHAEHMKTDAITEDRRGETNVDETNRTFGENGTAELSGGIARHEANAGRLPGEVQNTPGSLKPCSVQLKRLDMPSSLQCRPVRRNRGLRLKRILLREKGDLCADTLDDNKSASSKRRRGRDITRGKADPSSFVTDSFMAPISGCSEDDSCLSSCSDEGSCNKTASCIPAMADSWSDDLDDLDELDKSGDDSLFGCSKDNPSFICPKNVSATIRRKGVDDGALRKTRTFHCLICKEHVNTRGRTHMKTHFPTGDFACPRCDTTFKLYSSFKLHLNRSCFELSRLQVDSEKPHETKNLYKCDKCEEAFRYKVGLERHQRTHDKLYCSVCRKVLQDVASLARHKASHTLFQCNRCEESFVLFKPLLTHCQNVHKISRPFKCNHCPKTFPTLRLLIAHEWKHTGHLPFQCAHCGLRFRSDGDLVSHERVHTREKPYMCSECGRTFAHKPNLLRHLNFVHSESRNEKKHSCSHKCDKCEKAFRYKVGLERHKRTHDKLHCGEDDSCLSSCSDEGSCNKTTSCIPSMADSWSDDLDKSEDDSLIGCSKDDPSFICPKNVSATIRKKGVDDGALRKTRTFHCLICKERVNTRGRTHMKTHFPTGDFACPRCDTRFKLYSSFKLHLNRSCFELSRLQVDSEKPHKTKNLYKCDKCEEAFRYKIGLERHQRTHDKLYCGVCRKVLQDAASLARHKASHTLFQCNRCEESFVLFKPLLTHCQNVHKISRPFKCNHCPKTFSKLRLLIAHEWKHTGHLPFQCAHCGLRFRSDGDLVSHERVHTREKPYMCSECGRTFAHKPNLLRHLNFVHSESRNEKKHSCSHECDKCEKAFRYKVGLERHKRTHDKLHCGEDDSCLTSCSDEGSCNKTSSCIPTMADSWSNELDKSEDDSLFGCSKDDPSFICPKNVSATIRKKGVDDGALRKTRTFHCLICKEHVNTRGRTHMKTHFPTGDFACPRCDTRFKLYSSFKLHLNRSCFELGQLQVDSEKPHKTKSLYKCDKCEEAFRYKVGLERHQRTHDKLYCGVCRKVLQDAASLARHKASHTLFQCNRCEKSFVLFKPLLTHCQNVHKISRPFKCNHCPKTFSTLRLLIAHEWKHTGHLPFQCARCGLRFRSDGDLVSHERVHTREKPYMCSECGRTFAHKPNLLRHLNFVHGESRNEKKHSCSECETSFKDKGALKKHQRTKHLNECFRHPCTCCGKMISSSTIARHKLIHTGERPFKCTEPDCDKDFRSTAEVNRHVRMHHTAEKPYKCDVCGKGFIQMCILSAHGKIHSGEKPFVCPICGKAFPKLYSMRRHKKLKHTVL